MEVRFPDVDWFCDNCDSYLNNQRGFDDRKYIWKCRKCGYKNSISATNIRSEDPFCMDMAGFLLGVVRSIFVFALTILFLAEAILDYQPLVIFGHRLLTISALAYPILMIFSLVFERLIAKYGIHIPVGKWILTTIPVNILGDFFRPFQEVLSFPLALINLIRLKIKGISSTKYLRKKCLYAISYLCVLLFVAILIWKSQLYLLIA